MRTVEEIMATWSVDLQLAVSDYVVQHCIPVEKLLPVDLVLILLRIDNPEARRRVAELVGKPVTICPSGMPPWPPKPPVMPAGVVEPKVAMVVPNPCPPSTDMHRRFALVRPGLTREQLIARGCQARDIRYWQNKGHLRFA